MNRRLIVKDTTFRDGIQGERVEVARLDEALKAIQAIDACGVQYHEVGFAIASQADYDRIAAACKLTLNGKVCGFGRSNQLDVLKLIKLHSTHGMPAAVIVGKSRARDAEKTLIVGRGDNLRYIRQSVEQLVAVGLEVIFDAEHFFDAYWYDDRIYACDVLRTAAAAGARWIVLCDTNGGSTPQQIAEAVKHVRDLVLDEPFRLGVHTHNDRGRAIANAEAAFEAGVTLVEGTIGGIGERVGNMDLCTFIPNALLDFKVEGFEPEQCQQLRSTFLHVCDVLNLNPNRQTPWVGDSAGYTEAGMHESGQQRDPGSYLHADLAIVGNHARTGVTDQSGWANLVAKASEFDLELDSAHRESIMAAYRELLNCGGHFGEADASCYLFLLRQLNRLPMFFDFKSYRIIDENSVGKNTQQEASLRLELNGKPMLHNADGDGPLDALTNALRRTLHRRFPELKQVELVDYKSRAIDHGTGSRVRTLITFSDGEKTWTTMGVHTDSTAAAFEAIIDGFIYKLVMNGHHCPEDVDQLETATDAVLPTP